ncbi:phosphoribosylformylglycinamidine synthase I [Candidatus Saccharibacteria bacterium]|nr:phosphoribosylformylglycinamidine synthase I [Candidatus Saccharibacteria bacterium]
MSAPKGLLLQAPGINCDAETGHAFEQAGGEAIPVHVSQLLDGSIRMGEFDVVLASGGFSYGDTIRSGAILGRILRERLAEDLNTMVERGSPVVGICNGFQILVEAGLLPTGEITDEPKQVSLIYNERGSFECRWTKVEVGRSACRYLRPELTDTLQDIPVANGEGRFVSPGIELPEEQIVFRYVGKDGQVALYPENPSGSPDGIAAVCDPSGVVLGMMPHPERAYYQHQHQGWRRGAGINPFGAVLFKGIVEQTQQI